MEIPLAVYVIWWITLILAVVVILPLAVYLLHRTLMSARQIERYAAKALAAGEGIAGNTENVGALEETISTASGMLEPARSIKQRAAEIEEAFEARTGRR